MFCRKCGCEIPNDSLFCPKCGAQLDGGSIRPSMQTTHKLIIDRRSEVYIANPPIKVLIDGNTRLSVGNGQTVEVELTNGHHEVCFTSSIRKASLSLDINKDTVVEIGWNRLTGKLVAKVV